MSKADTKSGDMPKKQHNAKRGRIPIWIGVAIPLALFIAIALFLRIVLPYKDIFVGDWVKFASNDSYYYMRLVDNMVANFPHLLTFDQYLVYPNGESVGAYYLFARLIATISWVGGLGSPTQHVIDLVGVYTPAVLGALMVVPVYFIGKELAGRWAGLLSAGLIAILPGEFMGRSIIGYTDHHVAEVLLSATTMLFLIMAIKSARNRVVFSVLAGIFLGLYMLAWIGGLLLVFVISLYLTMQFVIDHMKKKPIGYLYLVGTIIFGVASAMFLPTVHHSFYWVVMMGVMLLPLVFSGVSKILAHREMKVIYYPIMILGVGAIGLAIFRLVNPSLFSAMVGMFSIFVAKGVQVTTIEMQPLLFPNGNFSLSVAWGNFGLDFYLALVSLLILMIVLAKRGENAVGVIAVWSAVMFAIAMGQRRFAYYLAVNVAVLVGYLAWLVLRWAGLKERNLIAMEKKGRRQKADYAIGLNISLVVGLVLLITFLPLVPLAVSVASQARYAPSDAWVESLNWLRENSPDPFMSDIEDSITKLMNNPEGGQIVLPEGTYVLKGDRYYQLDVSDKAQYGVMSWWDYGYWITRIAQRIPNANPSQNPVRQKEVASWLVAQDEESAGKISDRLGVKYVVIDKAMVTGKFWAIALYADKQPSDYFDVYYISEDGIQLKPIQLFYPEYYQVLSTRLYNFDGKAVTPKETVVISYEGKSDKRSNTFNVVTDAKQFITYEEAQLFLSVQQSGNWRIVGVDPFSSPIPLAEVNGYRLVYASSQTKRLSSSSGGGISEVKIFEVEK